MCRYGIVIGFFLFLSSASWALETDQYSLPPKPLVDLGDYVNDWVYEELEVVLEQQKTQLTTRQFAKRLFKRLTSCETKDGKKFRLIGGYCITKRFEAVMKDPELRAAFAKKEGNDVLGFRPAPSIFVEGATSGWFKWITHNNAWDNSLTLRGLSSTLKVFGVLVGTDKFGHFFKQGWQYYDRYQAKLDAEVDAKEARQEVVREFGVGLEQGFLGKYLSGIYGNADLATNYFGMLFYRNLFAEVEIDGKTLPPLLVLEEVEAEGDAEALDMETEESSSSEKIWALNPDVFKADDDSIPTFLKDYFTLHMNEALNPNWFQSADASKVIYAEIKKRCPDWKKAYPGRTVKYYEDLAEELSTWFGENYGYEAQPEGPFTIGAVCYSK